MGSRERSSGFVADLTETTIEQLDTALLESLSDPSGHPGDADAAGGVSVVQTHLSHVFLTHTQVYNDPA